MTNFPTVQGTCPACRAASLYLAAGGYVTCSRIECPNPVAASDLLDQTTTEEPQPQSSRPLTPVEQQAMRWLAQGYTVGQAAARCGTRARTIRNAAARARRALGARTIDQALQIYRTQESQ